jgi:outer membrane protein
MSARSQTPCRAPSALRARNVPRPAVITALSAVAALLLVGCSVDQRADVASYRAITDLEPPPARDRAAPMSLLDAVRLANAYNERLGIEGEAYVRTLVERQRQAASLMPTLDAFGDLALAENTGSGPRTARFDGGFTAQYTFFTGLTDLNEVRAAELDIRAQKWLLLDVRESLLIETARAYYAVLRAERLVEVLESSVRVQEERLRDIRGRQTVGFARPLDVAQIESQASATRVTLLDAQNAVVTARAALAFLTGVPVNGVTLTDGFDAAAAPPDAESVLPVAWRWRQDLLAVRSLADAARVRVDARLGAYFPSIRLNLDYFLVRDTSPDDLDLSSLISINLPIFSAGRLEADLREAWSLFRQRVLEHALLRRQVRRDVETAVADLATSHRRLDELSTQVRSASEALRQAEAAYGAGLGTNLERIAAQDQLLSAQLQQASERFVLKVASLTLLRACGRLTGDLTLALVPAPEPEELTSPQSPFIRVAPGSEPAPAQTATQPDNAPTITTSTTPGG